MQRRGDQKKSESQTNYRRNSSRLSGRSGSAQPQYQRVTSGKGGGSSVLPPPSPDSSVSSSPTTPRYGFFYYLYSEAGPGFESYGFGIQILLSYWVLNR